MSCTRPFRWVLLGLTLAIAALVSPAARAQQAKFTGKVTDASGAPVPQAKMVLAPTDGKGIRAEVSTKPDGSFILGFVRPGTYTVTIEAPGGLAITTAKGQGVARGRKEPDWQIDQPIRPGGTVTLSFGDGQDVTVDFVMGQPAAAAAPAEGSAVEALVKKVQEGDCAGALPELEALRTSTPSSARLHYLAAFCLERLGRHEEALAAIDRTLEVQPAFAGGGVFKGRVLKALGRVPEAEAEMKKEVETTTHDAVRLDAAIALALLYEEAGRVDEAIAAFEKVATLAPTKGETYAALSTLYAKKGDRAKAAEVLERGKQAGATADPAAALNVGIGYMNDHDYEAAAGVFRRLIEEGTAPKADLGMAWALLGRCQLNAGSMDEGMASLEKSLEIDPSGAMAEENRQILAAMKKK